MESAFSFRLPKGNGRNGQEEPGNAKVSIAKSAKKGFGKGGQRGYSSLAAFGRFGRVLAEQAVDAITSPGVCPKMPDLSLWPKVNNLREAVTWVNRFIGILSGSGNLVG